ncbi:MAG: cytochrome c oxidase assembly protein [Myxococcaceae bacterium]|nr:cytochrome c oxidase assembly protein [Myxococcaceae bacterium]
MRIASAVVAAALLATAWLGFARHDGAWPFTAHMTMHMLVVAFAAPLVAVAIGPRLVNAAPVLFSAMAVSLVELFVVWGWHAPAAHHFARHTTLGLVLEQATFFVTGTWLWLAALGTGTRAATGVVALLLTAMHMTLLGALLALATRTLYGHGALEDQHAGGAVMILAGGVSYLAGALWLTRGLLLQRVTS